MRSQQHNTSRFLALACAISTDPASFTSVTSCSCPAWLHYTHLLSTMSACSSCDVHQGASADLSLDCQRVPALCPNACSNAGCTMPWLDHSVHVALSLAWPGSQFTSLACGLLHAANMGASSSLFPQSLTCMSASQTPGASPGLSSSAPDAGSAAPLSTLPCRILRLLWNALWLLAAPPARDPASASLPLRLRLLAGMLLPIHAILLLHLSELLLLLLCAHLHREPLM